MVLIWLPGVEIPSTSPLTNFFQLVQASLLLEWATFPYVCRLSLKSQSLSWDPSLGWVPGTLAEVIKKKKRSFYHCIRNKVASELYGGIIVW